MRREVAEKIISGSAASGYAVSFWRVRPERPSSLEFDYFPEACEAGYQTEAQAWAKAAEFAQATEGVCLDISVMRLDTMMEVPSAHGRRISNRRA